MPLPPAVSVSWTTSQSGVASPYGWNTSNGGRTIRFDVQDSADCGGPNGNIQSGIATATLGAPARFNMSVSLTGLAERQDSGYENMTLRFNGVDIVRSTSPGGGQGCASGGPVRQTVIVPGPYFLPKNSINTFRLSFTTADELFHVNCFYQCNLTFTLLDPPEIYNFYANPNPQTSSSGTPSANTILFWSTFGAETLTINQGVGELSTTGGTIDLNTGLQSVAGSSSPATKTYTLTATNVAGTTTATTDISVYNDNTPSNTWISSFSNLEPSTTYELSLGTLQGVDMNTVVSTSGEGNFVGKTPGGSFNTNALFVSGDNVFLKFTTLAFNTDISGVTGLYGKTNSKTIPVSIGTQSFNVTVTTKAPRIGEDFNYADNKNLYPYEDIDLISNTPSQYITTATITVDDLDINGEIKTDNPNIQVKINNGSWINVRQI